MRAVQYTEHGGPDRLHVADVPEPRAGAGQVRVAVRTAGVNPLDWKVVSGMTSGGEPLAGPAITGYEAAGVVDQVGDGVEGVAIGDEVFGHTVGGAAAELAVLDAWAPKPAGLSWEEIGGFPVAVETALRCLELIDVRAGGTIVVDGAAGGVGQALVQVAAARSIGVVGTSGAANHERLRALGARPTTYGDGLAGRVRELAPEGVDGAVDAAGKGSLAELVELTGDPAKVVTIADFSGSVPGVHVSASGGEQRARRLREAAELAARGALALPVQRTYPLEEAAAAMQESLGGHVAGKLVLRVA